MAGISVRGLVETVRMEARAFVRDADRLLRSAPIHNVWLYRPAGLIQSLAALPALARLLSRASNDVWPPAA